MKRRWFVALATSLSSFLGTAKCLKFSEVEDGSVEFDVDDKESN